MLGVIGASLARRWREERALMVFVLVALVALFAHLVLGIQLAHALPFAFGPTAVAKREEALAALKKAKAFVDPETQEVSAENEEAFKAAMAEFRTLDAQAAAAAEREDEIGALDERMSWYTGKATGTPMRFNRTQLDPSGPKSLGQQFVESKAYRELKETGALDNESSRFRSDAVVLSPGLGRFGAAATDVIQTESGGPANPLIVPYRLPDILGLQQRPIVIRDLFPVESMPAGDTIEYAAQTGFDNAAAAVAQSTAVDGSGVTGGVKPQSSIAWSQRTAKAQWIATWMAATRQSLADESQVRSLIDNQGRLMLSLEEEDQLFNGNGTSPNIRGLLNTSGIQTLSVAHLGDNANLTAIRTARRLVKTGVSRLTPTFVAVNPIDSEEFDLMQDLEGRFRAGDPFQVGGGLDSPPIWKLPRIETEALAEGTVLVGSRAGATIYERQPITVLTADQHADFFVRNLVVILFEERVAFPVYFPTAFVDVTLDAWSAGS